MRTGLTEPKEFGVAVKNAHSNWVGGEHFALKRHYSYCAPRFFIVAWHRFTELTKIRPLSEQMRVLCAIASLTSQRDSAGPGDRTERGQQKASMTCTILDGKALAAQIELELTSRVAALKARNGNRTPILATILVGDDSSSATYVKMKRNACPLRGGLGLTTHPEKSKIVYCKDRSRSSGRAASLLFAHDLRCQLAASLGGTARLKISETQPVPSPNIRRFYSQGGDLAVRRVDGRGPNHLEAEARRDWSNS